MLSKESAETQEKTVGSIAILPKEPSYASNEVRYPMLSAGATAT